ncbi:MAG: hypothetical protein LPL00_00165 [Alphaproteobacteria bacterium]|nr:hypothetical protein [Alphaproteobacteria bacterium]MDX5367770.1 hypothetical protein [Alphaproteobacteria bacterium]MDX5462653.1 hypothetical protein [Alphaproteobacteria bacterium]
MKVSRSWIRNGLIALPLACLLGAGGTARAIEWETLFEKGAWRTDINIHDDGALSCESLTRNDDDVTFTYFTHEDGELVMLLHSDDWHFPAAGEDDEYVIQIDRNTPWNVEGTKRDQSIRTVFDPDSDAAPRFFREIYRGSVLVVRNDRGREITRFSLSGSAAAMHAHAECRERILDASVESPRLPARSRDPF